jgi:hypothetical protein
MLTAEKLLLSPTVSVWLKAALQEALKRDPVDVANDATVLANVLNARADAQLAVEIARLGLHPPGNAST